MLERGRVDVLLLGEFSVNSCLEKGKFTKLAPRQRRVVLLLGELTGELLPRTRVVLSLEEFTMKSSLRRSNSASNSCLEGEFPN